MPSRPCGKRHSMPASVHRRIEKPATSGTMLEMPNKRCISTKQLGNASDSKYAQPQLNSVLHQAYEIKLLEAQLKTGAKPKCSTDSAPPARYSATIAPLVTQKLNFNTAQTVFKNLTPINVNDSLLLTRETTALRNQYMKSCHANKLPVPMLCDFLDPLPPITHHIPDPDIFQEFPAPNFDYYETVKQLLN